MEIVACGVPQYYNFQAGYYKHRRKTLFPIAVWNQFDNDGSINNYYFFYSSHPNTWIFIQKIQESTSTLTNSRVNDNTLNRIGQEIK